MNDSITSIEKGFLKAYLENAVKNYNYKELECELRSGLPLSIFEGSKNEIDFSRFRKLDEFFANGIKDSKYDISVEKKGVKHSLDISVTNSNYKVDLKDAINNLRFTLKGKDSIKEYCLNNTLPGLNSRLIDLIYKHDFTWKNSDEVDKSILSRIVKNGYKNSSDRCLIDIESLRTRLGGKVEIEYNKIKKEFTVSDLQNESLKDIKDNANIALNAFKKRDYRELYKTYRLKERTSYLITLDNMKFYVDLTKVKESRKSSNRMVPVKRFIDSQIGGQNEKYEYEIEFSIINDKQQYSDSVNQVETLLGTLDKFISGIYIKSIEHSDNYPLFTPYNVQKDILYIYNRLLNGMLLRRVEKKIEVIRDLKIYNTLKKIDEKSENDIKNIDSLEKKYNNNPYNLFRILKDNHKIVLDELLEKYANIINNPKKIEGHTYISPKVVSINMDNVRRENEYSIFHNYTVTDKADGLNMMLFKIGLEHLDESDKEKYAKYNNMVFLIDSNLKVYNTDIKASYNKNSHVFNGEYLLKDSNDNLLNKFAVFDSYIFDGEDVCSLKLMSTNEDENTRIKIALDYFQNGQYIDTNNNDKDFGVFVKDFRIATDENDIFYQSNQIWGNYRAGVANKSIGRMYTLDGLIYTPSEFPVGYKVDSLYGGLFDYDLRQDTTWRMNLKWKPPRDNTIDFLLRFEKEGVASYDGNTIYRDKVKRILDESVGEKSYKEYKIGNLYCGDRKILNSNPCRVNDKVKKGAYKPYLFKPTSPPDNDIYTILIPITYKNGNRVCLDLDNEIIDDDTIVEVSYSNFDKEMHGNEYIFNGSLRWGILRTRHDKTFQYKNGLDKQKSVFENILSCLKIVSQDNPISSGQSDFLDNNRYLLKSVPKLFFKNTDKTKDIFSKNRSLIENHYKSYEDVEVGNVKFGNDYLIANNIWSTIHNPVTEEMITTGNDIPGVEEEDEKYYNKSDNWERNKSLTLEMQNFHNKVVKNRVLLGNVSNYLRAKGNNDISLLDFACGKGADIPKWRDNDISTCVGIDYTTDNILNPTDGACERYNYYKKNPRKDKKLPQIHFLKGDISKSIETGEAFSDIRFKEYYRDLWNISELGTNFSENKFDIVSIMFAIHYLFESKEKLDTLIDNIDKNLKKGGFFIGTTFDGSTIHTLLSDPNVRNVLQEYKGGQIIWKIKKKYSKIDFPDDENSLGMPIDVLIFSINKIIPEFLVNFNYLIKRLEERGIKPLTEEEMESMDLPVSDKQKIGIGSFREVFNKISKEKNSVDMYKNITDNLSEEEKRFSFLFNYFIFRKKTTDDETIEEIYNYITLNSKIFAPIFKLKTLYMTKSLVKLEALGYNEILARKAVQKVKDDINSAKFKFPDTKIRLVTKKSSKSMASSEPSVSIASSEPGVSKETESGESKIEAKSEVASEAKPTKLVGIKPKLVLKKPKKTVQGSAAEKPKKAKDFNTVYTTWKAFIKQSKDKETNIRLTKNLLQLFDNEENRAKIDVSIKLREVRIYLESLNK